MTQLLLAAVAACGLAHAARPQPYSAGLRDSHGPRLTAEPMAVALGEGARSFTPVPSPPSPPCPPRAQPPPPSGPLPAQHPNDARLASSPPADLLVPSRGRVLSAYHIGLRACVKHASGLSDQDNIGKSDPYFQIVRPARYRRRTHAPRSRSRAPTHALQRTHGRAHPPC